MNKLFIVILAVCLVTVNSALVKRETAAASSNILEDVPKKLEELSKSLQEQFSKALDPEKFTKSISEGFENINKWVQDATKQGEAKQ